MIHNCGFSRRGLLGLALVGLPALLSCDGAAASEISSAISQPLQADDRSFMERAFEMRQLAIDSGDQAYGAIVVRAGVIVGQAASHVVTYNDPTAHAEMEAIRDAARRLKRHDLGDCSLYSSSAACPMCEAAAYWAGIQRMVSGETIRDRGRPELC
jgi:tRNA(Arg) A34 adenosine deaminase TadA